MAFTQSGYLQIAMCGIRSGLPNSSGRMPAVGIVADNVASGQNARLYHRGRISSTTFNFSGIISKPVWVGLSGDLISKMPTQLYSGSLGAGGAGIGILWGAIDQRIGEATSHSGLFMGSMEKAVGPRAATLVVDPAGNGDFQDIQSAVNALHYLEGGTIILREGKYWLSSGLGTVILPEAVPIVFEGTYGIPDGLAAVGKGTVIYGASGVPVFSINDSAGALYPKVFKNIRFYGNSTASGSPIIWSQNAGDVLLRFENCAINRHDCLYASGLGGDVIELENTDITITGRVGRLCDAYATFRIKDSTITGGIPPVGFSGPQFIASGSTVGMINGELDLHEATLIGSYFNNVGMYGTSDSGSVLNVGAALTLSCKFDHCLISNTGIVCQGGITSIEDCDINSIVVNWCVTALSGATVDINNSRFGAVYGAPYSGCILLCGLPYSGMNGIVSRRIADCHGTQYFCHEASGADYTRLVNNFTPTHTSGGYTAWPIIITGEHSEILDGQLKSDQFLWGDSFAVSGAYAAAQYGPGGFVAVTAMPGLSGRWPAIGVVIGPIGTLGNPTVYQWGPVHSPYLNFANPVWLNDAGKPVFAGLSGAITTVNPISSGALAQQIGYVLDGSGMFVTAVPPIQSGTIQSYQFTSGAIIDAAQFTATNFVAAENISGVRAVAFAGTSGQVQIAMAWLGGSGMFPVQTSRMPAIGVVIDNVLAGATVRVYERGIVSVASGFSSIYASGLLTSGTLYVQASGTITGARPGITSGVNYPVIQTIGSLCQWSGFININPGFVGLANPKPVTVVVDPAGNGDFTDITDATNALTHRGGTVILREGRHIISLSGVIVGSGAVPITYVGAGVSMAVGSGTDVKRGFGTIVDFSNVVLGVASGAFRVGGTGGTQGRTIKFQNIHFWSRFTSGLLFNLGTSAVRDDWIFEDCLIECAGQVFRGTNYPGSIYLNRSKIYLPWPAWSGQPNACTLVGQSQLAIRAVDSDILLGSGNLDSGYIYNGLCKSGGQNYLSLYMRHGTLDMGANPISTDGNIMCNLYLEDVAVQNQKNNADASLDPLVVQTARDCTISSFEVSAIDVLHNCTVVGPNSVAVRLLSGMLANIENLKLPSALTFSGAIWVEDGARGVVNGICAQDIGSFGQLVTDVSASGSRSRITYSNIVWNYASGATHSGYGAVSDGSIIEGQQLYDYRQSIDEFSGPKAVTYAGSGLVQIAMAGISGRMPAVGVSFDSPSSGDGTMFSMGVLIKYWGRVNSFLLNFSGYPVGQSIWVGQSGDLVLTPPTGSGMPQQIIGQVTDGSGMFVGNLCAGLVGSGQITQTMLASGVGGGATTWTTSYVAGEALSGGEFLVFSGAKIVTLAYASGTWDHASVVGVSAAAVLSGASIACETLCGRDVRVQMEASLSGLVAGKPVYLSALSRGACTTIAPTTSGNTSKLLGWISSTSGYLSGSVASSLLSIVFQPGQQILLG